MGWSKEVIPQNSSSRADKVKSFSGPCWGVGGRARSGGIVHLSWEKVLFWFHIKRNKCLLMRVGMVEWKNTEFQVKSRGKRE